jgi:hypothetical protein
MLSTVLECLPHPALIVDAERRVRAANALLRARFPAGRRLIGAHCFEILHGRTRRCRMGEGLCPLDTCLRAGEPAHAVHSHAAPEGFRREGALVQPIRDDAGRVVACLTTLRRASA